MSSTLNNTKIKDVHTGEKGIGKVKDREPGGKGWGLVKKGRPDRT